MPDVSIRAATSSDTDADALARLIAIAGEGMPQLVWEEMREPGETVWDVGRRRAQRGEGSFSYRNAMLAEVAGEVRAGMVSYGLAAEPEPWSPEEVPPMFRSLQELEDLAAGSWYVMVLAAFEGHRGQGLGAALLAHADVLARAAGRDAISIIVRDANRARRLYERVGYVEQARRAIVRTGGWDVEGKDWVLLVKPL